MKFLIILLLVGCPSLNNNSKNTPNIGSQEMSNFIEIKNQEGRVGYWMSPEKYTISYWQKGTVDGQYTCLIDGDFPKEFKREGLEVVFSGKIYQNASTPKPMMGGQQVYWLKISKIQKK